MRLYPASLALLNFRSPALPVADLRSFWGALG